jgi:antitoxin MazE
MSTKLKTHLIKIGNSQGVRIPKIWLKQLALGSDIEMFMESDQIVIRQANRPRHTWDEQFRIMAAHGDDRMLEESTTTQWDKDEWEW